MILSYEDFFSVVWDYVSENIVDDDLWEAHEDNFYELTFELYEFYSKTTISLPSGDIQELLSPKVCARLIESFIKNFKSSINC